MACVCPPKEESDKKAKILCRLKKILRDIEDEASVPVNPLCVPCCVPICNFQDLSPCPCPPPAKEPVKQEVMETPNLMVCYKIPPKKRNNKTEDSSSISPSSPSNRESEVIRLKPSTSRELRASILYKGCDCEKRSGLQDDCPRTGCHGSPECLTKPPCCGPSEFCDGKHLAKKALLYSKKHARSNGNGNGNGNGVTSGNGNGNGNDTDSKNNGDAKSEEIRYKCFPAVLKAPVCCPPCCQPCCPPC